MDISTLAGRLAGKFIVFDGPDGAGKSTQRDRVREALCAAGAKVVTCHDPGGTEIGDRIRSVLLDYDLSTMDVNCEALLFMASRAQLVAEVIRPALAANQTVLCDRFVTATCAYQGAAGYDPRRVIELAPFAIQDCWPDVTVILDLEADEGFRRTGREKKDAGKNRTKRIARTGAEQMLFEGAVRADAMEARPIEFHRRVRRMFLEVHEYYPARVITVDARGDIDAVHRRILEELQRVAG